MRLVTLRTPAGTRAGRVHGDGIVELPFDDLDALLRSGTDWRDRAGADGPRHPLDGADLAPPVRAPRKIVCLGLNYRAHILEMGRALPAHPTLFAKFARALIGPSDSIALPPESATVDWEAELGLVIGRSVRRASEAQAVAAIAGYTVANDVSMRDWQLRTDEWLQGKTFEASTPVGPALVTPDELDGDPGAPDLEISCDVDGEVLQRARTGDLLFNPGDIVAYVSTLVTLEPGDLILTGTPGGVGAGRDPKVFLRPGQTVRTTVEGLGELVNRCEEERV
ncbi:MAG: fumarylacetoacetate hydrolase family protein [Euzebyales bacterium]|nr:fumarylacetoacetate hydrolase family protein [Euzebyales bacterium]